MGLLAAGVTTGSITIDRSELTIIWLPTAARLATTSTSAGQSDVSASQQLLPRCRHCSSAEKPRFEQRHRKQRIFDNDGTASYSMILPQWRQRDHQEQHHSAVAELDNPAIIAYSAETSSPWAGSQLVVSGNTIVNQMSGAGIGVRNFSNSHHREHHGQFHIYGLPAARSPPAQYAIGQRYAGKSARSRYVAFLGSKPWTTSYRAARQPKF